MKKAGGIIALIAGIFGTFAAIITLFFGGLASAFNANGASTVVGLGWGGVFFSFLVIILGAISISAVSKIPGSLIIVSSIAGGILGGTLVLVFMVLSLVGGILVVLDKTKEQSLAPTSPNISSDNTREKRKIFKVILASFLGIVIIVVILALVANQSSTDNQSMGHAKSIPYHYIGQTVTTNKFAINIISVKELNKISNGFGGYKRPEKGAVFVAVHWSYKNISNKPIGPFSTPSLHLIDSSGVKYSSSDGASADYEMGIKNTNNFSAVNPGITVNDGDIFEVSSSRFNPQSWKIKVSADKDVYFSLTKNSQASNESSSDVPEKKIHIASVAFPSVSGVVAHVDNHSYFHKYSYGITEVGNTNAGPLMISQDGHKLETTLSSSPVAYGHNFHSIFGIGKYHFYGVVTYKGNHFYILNNMAGGGQDYVALWQIAWRNRHGGFSVTNFFGTENPNAHVSVHDNIIKLRMNGPHGTVTYHVNMDKLIDNAPLTYSSLNRKLSQLTSQLDADYKNAISTMSSAQAQKFQESEINWIIKKRKVCGTTAEEVASRSKSDVTCQIKMAEQRIAQISSE